MKKMFLKIITGVILFLFIGTSIFCFINSYKKYAPLYIYDKDMYLEIEGDKSEFIIFPDTIENKDVVKYEYIDFRLNSGASVELIIKYNNQSFEEEIERLENIRNISNENTKKLSKDVNKTLFNWVTYISIYNSTDDIYEYACLNYEKQEIVYVYLEYIHRQISYVEFDYLPFKIAYYSDDYNYEYTIY